MDNDIEMYIIQIVWRLFESSYDAHVDSFSYEYLFLANLVSEEQSLSLLLVSSLEDILEACCPNASDLPWAAHRRSRRLCPFSILCILASKDNP